MSNKERTVADLTGYATLLGESFASKIHLLSQIVRDAHYPSVGRYKEKLLANTISEYIPKNFEVGTGFVLFPMEPKLSELNNPDFDHLNMGAHVLSKQCDIIVYDSSAFPVVFRDGDFVVVRPESVKSVIEVKGSINRKEISSTLKSFHDFGKKWRECQMFYKSHHQEVVKKPSLFVMGWEIYKDKNDRPSVSCKSIREQVAKFYRENIDFQQLAGLPILEKVLIYNECEISLCGWSDKIDGEFQMKEGYHCSDGRFTRFDDNSKAYRSGDRTVASLVASIHWNLGNNFNRFFSYTDETRSPEKHIPYEHSGFSFFIENNDDAIKALNTDVPD